MTEFVIELVRDLFGKNAQRTNARTQKDKFMGKTLSMTVSLVSIYKRISFPVLKCNQFNVIG